MSTILKLKRRATGFLPVAVLIATSAGAMAQGEGGSIPLDLESAGTTIAGYVTTAAGAALPIFIAMIGIGIILRAFGIVGKRR